MKIDHVGIAVESIEGSARFYRELGLAIGSVEEVAEQKVRAAVIPAGESRIELLEPTDPEGPIGKFIAKKGPGIHHLAVEVTGIEEKLLSLEKMGFQLIDRVPRKGVHGSKIAFVHPKSAGGVLIELCERPK